MFSRRCVGSDVGAAGSARSTGVGEVASGGLRTGSIVATLQLLARVERMLNGSSESHSRLDDYCIQCAS